MGLILLALGLSPAAAQAAPSHQIPPSVLAEMRVLESRFELALAADCDSERCFSKGCTYIEHAVADQARPRSLPGLGLDMGPGSVEAQEYLTRAQCAFTHEASVDTRDVQSLVRRLQAKVSGGWTVVSVNSQALTPLPQYMRKPPTAEVVEEPEDDIVAAAAEPGPDTAGRELWLSLLPHFYWMIGLGLITLTGAALIWAWRRVGVASIEEQMLLAELAQETPREDPTAGPETSEADPAFVTEQTALWRERLARLDGETPDPELQALIRALLRSGDMPLLAKAVLTFPERLPAAFPSGGDVASAKLALADYLTEVSDDALYSDEAFFTALNRHALSAALSSQTDAELVRSLRDDFGAAGLVALIEGLPARPGALLFGLAPAIQQHEMIRLLSIGDIAEMCEQLLRSDRMSPGETAYLFQVLAAARDELPPPAPPQGDVPDRGATIDAAGALSVLLGRLSPQQRAALFTAALQRFNGSLPAWYRGILVADMLFALTDEWRADLLLEVEVETLAAWLSLLDTDTRARLLAGLPESLRASIAASSSFSSRPRQIAMAERARRDLAGGFQRQLARANATFEQVVAPQAGAT